MPNKEPRGVDCADWSAAYTERQLELTANFNLRRSVEGGRTPQWAIGRFKEFFAHQCANLDHCLSTTGNVITITAPASYRIKGWLEAHNATHKNDRILAEITESLDMQKRGETVRAATSRNNESPHSALPMSEAPAPVAPAPPVVEKQTPVANEQRLPDVDAMRKTLGLSAVADKPKPKPYGNGPLLYFDIKREPKERYDHESADFWGQAYKEALKKREEDKAKGRGKH